MILREGMKWTIPPAILSVIFLLMAVQNSKVLPVFLIFAAITAIITLFFRDPERRIGDGVVSPADGTVLQIIKRDGYHEVHIFLNIYNVHVVRSPIEGTVVGVEDMSGGHKPAFARGAEKNRKVRVMIKEQGHEWVVELVGGLLARKPISWVRVGDRVLKGERIGMITFGSRVILRIPEARAKILAKPNEKVVGGETTIGEFL